MAPSTNFCFVLFFFACSLIVHDTIATKVNCKDLHAPQCMFAVASDGKRCVLESDICKSSELTAKRFAGHIETDKCMNACGLGRQHINELSDEFLTRLCSPACFVNCPNVVDLFSTLAAVQGMSLPQKCATSAQPPSASSSSESSTRRSSLDSAPAATPTAGTETFFD